jgi:G3E family GTPase
MPRRGVYRVAHPAPTPRAPQIAFADRILLNKIDLVTPAEVATIEGRIKAINRAANIVHTKNSVVDLSFILGVKACQGPSPRLPTPPPLLPCIEQPTCTTNVCSSRDLPSTPPPSHPLPPPHMRGNHTGSPHSRKPLAARTALPRRSCAATTVAAVRLCVRVCVLGALQAFDLKRVLELDPAFLKEDEPHDHDHGHDHGHDHDHDHEHGAGRAPSWGGLWRSSKSSRS